MIDKNQTKAAVADDDTVTKADMDFFWRTPAAWGHERDPDIKRRRIESIELIRALRIGGELKPADVKRFLKVAAFYVEAELAATEVQS